MPYFSGGVGIGRGLPLDPMIHGRVLKMKSIKYLLESTVVCSAGLPG